MNILKSAFNQKNFIYKFDNMIDTCYGIEKLLFILCRE